MKQLLTGNEALPEAPTKPKSSWVALIPALHLYDETRDIHSSNLVGPYD
jgi:hypothetical protein